MRDKKVFLWIAASLFAAVTCMATIVFNVPLPWGGYVHMGDSMVLLSGFLLGPLFGPIAAGLGSMLGDFLLGYALYAPGTLVIKALTAFIAASLYSRVPSEKPFAGKRILAMAVAGVVAEAVMVAGYFLYEGVFLGVKLAALGNVPANLGQAAFGILSAIYLTPFLERIPLIRDRLLRFRE